MKPEAMSIGSLNIIRKILFKYRTYIEYPKQILRNPRIFKTIEFQSFQRNRMASKGFIQRSSRLI